MLPTTLHAPPQRTEWIALEEYETATPQSFDTRQTTVLHLAVEGAAAQMTGTHPYAASLGLFAQAREQTVDVYVTSASLMLYSSAAQRGVAIPYPVIALHAIKHLDSPAQAAVWMQLDLAPDSDADAEPLDLTLIPPPSTSAQALFDAISACSELHPDTHPDSDEDNFDRIVFGNNSNNSNSNSNNNDANTNDPSFDTHHPPLNGFHGVLRGSATGDLPDPMPGSGGWITAENVDDFFDEQGNWRGRGAAAQEPQQDAAETHEQLGPGAGRIRAHAEMDPAAAVVVNGHGLESDADSENKRPRVD